MVLLVIVLGVVSIVSATVAWFLLGFRLGGTHWQNELLLTQMEAASARRQLFDLTRQAFVGMAKHAQRARGVGDPT